MKLDELSEQQIKNYYEKVKIDFDEWAEGVHHLDYDRSVNKTYFAPIELSNRLLKRIDADNIKIIDFACGTGISGEPFIRKGHEVDGLDLSDKMISYAKSKGYRNTWNINAVTGDTSFLRGYDLALCIGCLGDYVLPHAIIPKMIQSLKDEAIIGFTILDDWEIDFSKAASLLNESGFSNINMWRSLGVKSVPIGGGHVLNKAYYNYFVAERF